MPKKSLVKIRMDQFSEKKSLLKQKGKLNGVGWCNWGQRAMRILIKRAFECS